MIDMGEFLERKLARMKPSEQQFIRAAREDRVFWRGDDFEFFKLVYEQTMLMRSIEPDPYRKAAVKRSGRLVSKMKASK